MQKGTPIFLLTVVHFKFQVLFHSLLGVLFNFPSRYFSLSVNLIIFKLKRWSSFLQINYLPFYSIIFHTSIIIRSTSLFIFIFFTEILFSAYSVFATPLLTESLLFSFPLVTEMFHFTRFLFFFLGNFAFHVLNIVTLSKLFVFATRPLNLNCQSHPIKTFYIHLYFIMINIKNNNLLLL